MVKSNLNFFPKSVCVCLPAALWRVMAWLAGLSRWSKLILEYSIIFTFGKIMLTTYLSVGIVISAVSPLGGETLALAGENALLGVA